MGEWTENRNNPEVAANIVFTTYETLHNRWIITTRGCSWNSEKHSGPHEIEELVGELD
jgi:hypothetical protein